MVADLLSRSDDATGMVLDLLDNEMIHQAGSQGLAFETLRHRLHREPLPPKDWMQRALSACRKYPLGEAKALYYEITGRQKADR